MLEAYSVPDVSNPLNKGCIFSYQFQWRQITKAGLFPSRIPTKILYGFLMYLSSVFFS